MTLVDDAQRRAVVAERARNVIVDAGAGTGKTTLIVERLVEMVAPSAGVAPIGIARLAAVTFTRRAAGELRLRIRERLLRELATAESPRHGWLVDALAGLDTAHVGTIHGFADRLLRLHPVAANLSPAYDIIDDEEPLVQETTALLIQAAQEGTLDAAAAATVVDALRAGVMAQSREVGWVTRHGLDGLVRGFVTRRDAPPGLPDERPFDLAAFRAAADEFRSRTALATGTTHGERWLARGRALLERLRDLDDPVAIIAEVAPFFRRVPKLLMRDFDGADGAAAYEAWQAFIGLPTNNPVRVPSLQDALLAPGDAWLARRLVRLEPVIIALYESVKARRRVLDQLDLLLKLRDLLRDDRAARGALQQLFDHIFVDEFQDTDPLQAEIVLYLAERAPLASRWRDVRLADGKLTIVGDPKQSIYRFRRADVAMYAEARALVAAGAHLEAKLVTNFRSRGALVAWFNDRFERVLGPAVGGRLFDAASGAVFHQPMAAARPEAPAPRVHVLPLVAAGDKPSDDTYRGLEAEALARYLRALVDVERPLIRDPLDRSERPVRFGDIAVLAVSTYRLDLLLRQLDAHAIPHAARGGRLFLDDPLSKQFLLGLRAIADRDDGVAAAALLRPPFFAVDLLDLVQERAGGSPRASEALALVMELRRRRFERPPGTTARDLLERTGFGRAVAVGPNGAQRLDRLRELCLVLSSTAARAGLDYDGATERLRAWVSEPIALDAPPPVGDDALQVTTVHQAKGLEFPVVVLWDGRGKWDTRLEAGPWFTGANGWVLNLYGLEWEDPAPVADGLRERDRRYRDAERRRVIYVAATRARDLLIVPSAGELKPTTHVCAQLLDGAPVELVRELAPYVQGVGAAPATTAGAPVEDPETEARVAESWSAALAQASRPRRQPIGVAARTRLGLDALVVRPSRFGASFGDVVHRAIGLALGSMSPEVAVRVAGVAPALAAEAVADVTRALAALAALGLRGPPGPGLRLEYPVAAEEGDALLVGYVDLVGVVGDGLVVIDFKTDAPPPAGAPPAPEYVAQVHTYARLLGGARAGLLFTADGVIRWC